MAYVGDTFRTNGNPFTSFQVKYKTNTAFTLKFVDANGDNVNMVNHAFTFTAYRSSVNTSAVFIANVSNIVGYDGRVDVGLADTELNVAQGFYLFDMTDNTDALISGTIEVLNRGGVQNTAFDFTLESGLNG